MKTSRLILAGAFLFAFLGVGNVFAEEYTPAADTVDTDEIANPHLEPFSGKTGRSVRTRRRPCSHLKAGSSERKECRKERYHERREVRKQVKRDFAKERKEFFLQKRETLRQKFLDHNYSATDRSTKREQHIENRLQRMKNRQSVQRERFERRLQKREDKWRSRYQGGDSVE